MDGGGDEVDAAAGARRRRRRPWIVVGVPAAVAVLVGVTVVTGVPGLRPSMASLNAVADKINECAPGSASVDWFLGQVDTNGEPLGPGVELTPAERELLGANGKVGYLCPPRPIEG